MADNVSISTGSDASVATDDLGGVHFQVMLLGAVHANVRSGNAVITNTSSTEIIAAAGSGVQIVVTKILVMNAHASVSTTVTIRDGTTTKASGYAAAGGGGFALDGDTPIFVGTANTAVTAICGTTGASVHVTICGYVITP